MFAEKMASVIGPSYTLAFFVGGAIGLTKIPPPQARRTYRLLMNNYLNNIGKTSARFGNNVGAAIFLYLLVGKSLNFVMQEELENVPEEADVIITHVNLEDRARLKFKDKRIITIESFIDDVNLRDFYEELTEGKGKQ